MMRLATMAAAAALVLGAPAMAQQAAPQEQQTTDEQTAAAPGDARQTLDSLAQDVMAAQQMGYLAADKNMAAGYALLGDQVAMTNSQINRRLDQLVSENNVQLDRQMTPEARQRFEAMKGQNQERFAQDFVTFIQDTYPRIISGIETLSRQSPNSPAVVALNQDLVPSLRDQMRTAQTLAEGGGAQSQQSAQQPEGSGPIQRKDDPAVIPDTTSPAR